MLVLIAQVKHSHLQLDRHSLRVATASTHRLSVKVLTKVSAQTDLRQIVQPKLKLSQDSHRPAVHQLQLEIECIVQVAKLETARHRHMQHTKATIVFAESQP